MNAGWGGGLEGQVLLRLEDAAILALCHLPHELLGASFSVLGTVSRGVGSEVGHTEAIWSLGSEAAFIPSTLAVSHHPLPRTIRKIAVPKSGSGGAPL